MPFVITHWINLVAMILLIITGFSIHFPFWGGFMGIARGVHVFLGFVLFINCIVRVIMAFFVKSAPDGGTRCRRLTTVTSWARGFATICSSRRITRWAPSSACLRRSATWPSPSSSS